MRPLVLSSLLALAACSHAVPQELVDARAQYESARRTQTATYATKELTEAHQALALAQQEYEVTGDLDRVRDRAYIASRKVELANAKARIEVDRRKAEALKQQAAAAEAKRQKSQLPAVAPPPPPPPVEVAKAPPDPGPAPAVTPASAAAAAPSADALEPLTAFATLSEDARGLVIVVPAALIFTPGAASLSDEAPDRLGMLVAALGDRRIRIEVHTDDTAAAAHNVEASLLRARVVRDWLIEHGMKADRIHAEGVGDTKPLTDNGTPEGRAINRRLEIVVEAAPVS